MKECGKMGQALKKSSRHKVQDWQKGLDEAHYQEVRSHSGTEVVIIPEIIYSSR